MAGGVGAEQCLANEFGPKSVLDREDEVGLVRLMHEDLLNAAHANQNRSKKVSSGTARIYMRSNNKREGFL